MGSRKTPNVLRKALLGPKVGQMINFSGSELLLDSHKPQGIDIELHFSKRVL